MERQRWRIRLRPPSGQRAKRGGKSAPIDAGMQRAHRRARKFLSKTRRRDALEDLVVALLEDMFVIDAATLYCQRTRSGQLYALAQLDGATIKRVIDDWGRTPFPFDGADGARIYPPAYQQVLKGLPAVNYSAHDIIYRPRNVRAHRVYGYSPVQQVLMTVNIALRRQLWQLDYFSEGSIPDALIGVPRLDAGPDQAIPGLLGHRFAGDLAKRRRAKFVPGEAAARSSRPRSPSTRTISTNGSPASSATPFRCRRNGRSRLMNRATADNQSAQAEEEGLEPTKEWVKDLIDEIIAEEFASPIWSSLARRGRGRSEGPSRARRPRQARRRHAQRNARRARP